MANLENLTPWKEGQSGNPFGKPKGALNRATILKQFLGVNLKENLKDIPIELEGKITVEEAIALALIKKALSGDISAIKEIHDTLHGKIVEPSDVTMHTYTQMGHVMVRSVDGTMEALSFDVGSEPYSCRSE